MEIPRILFPRESRPLSAQEIGGKAANLLRLEREGAVVPPWFCLTARVYEEVSCGPFPQALETEILSAFDRCFSRGQTVAVRSSAVGEDSASDSYAGQLDTYLCVRREDLIDRIRRCFASTRSDHFLFYRKLRGQEAAPLRFAVIVQEMVPSKVSGVLFTASPTTGDADEIVISAAFGLGEGVVADRAVCDSYSLDKKTGAIRKREIRRKTHQVAPSSSGTREIAVSEAEAVASALSDGQLDRLRRIAIDLENEFGAPQDVEWAFDASDRLFLLQSRPVTAMPPEAEQVFDNTNVVESYPGITTPLTFSVVRVAYETALRQTARAMGVSERVLNEERELFRNLVAYIDGRVYYNLGQWYRMYTLLPGFEGHVRSFEESLGLPAEARLAKRRFSLIDRMRTRYCLLKNYFLLDRQARQFEERFERAAGAVRTEGLSVSELVAQWEGFVRAITPGYEATTLNDFYAFAFFQGVRTLLQRWHLGELHNDLLCGVKEVRSVDPVRSLLAITERIRSTPAWKDLVLGPDDERHVWRRIEEECEFADLREALRKHVRKFGDRTVQELKLESPLLEDDPSPLMALVRMYLRSGRTVSDLESDARERAERTVLDRLRGHPIRRRVFRWVLDRCRATLRYRERMRLVRSRIAGTAKRVFRAIGARLAAERRIDRPEDVFFLEWGELRTESLRPLVAIRRAKAAECEQRNPPARIRIRGSIERGRREAVSRTQPEAADVLEGTGCSSGVVRGRARIVLRPEAEKDVEGKILVAPMTDPGWVFLMVAARGLVVERGSALSHTAIIGRELGIPTVVGVDGATERIREGQEIELDGGRGTVRLFPG